MTRRLGVSLFLLVYGFLLYKIFGTLFGTFRTDELYFLYDSWSAFSGFSASRGIPPLFNELLKGYWHMVDGRVDVSWMLRIWLAAVAVIQACVLFAMTSAVFPTGMWCRRLLQILASIVFVTTMCSYRGYEVRPEVVPNTLLLLSVYALFFADEHGQRTVQDWIRVIVAGLGLIVAASMSFRYTLPAGILLLIFAFESIRRNGWKLTSSDGVAFAVWGAWALYLNFFHFNILESIEKAAGFQAVREPLSLVDRLAVGGGSAHLYAKAAILLCILVVMLSRRTEPGERQRPVAPVAVIVALLAYYGFLFTADVRPFEYVRSIEWVLLSMAVLLAFKGIDWRGTGRQWYYGAALVTSISVVAICKEAVDDVDRQRSTALALEGLRTMKSTSALLAAPDSDLALWAASNASIVDQVRARAEFCRRHPEGLAIVHTFNLHPVCLRDAGSLRLSGWEGSIDLKVIEFDQLQWFSLSIEQTEQVAARLADVRNVGSIYIR